MSKWNLEPYRSGGFINRDYDKGRVYIDLPITEAKRLLSELNHNCIFCKDDLDKFIELLEDK